MKSMWVYLALAFILLMPVRAVGPQTLDAYDLLNLAKQTYQEMRSYYFEGDIIAEIGLPGKAGGTIKHETAFVTAVVNPDKVRGEMVNPRRHIITLSDGNTTRQVTMNPQGEYVAQTTEALFERSDFAYEKITERMKDAQLLRMESIEMDGREVMCNVVRVVYERRPETKGFDPSYRTYWIDRARNVVLKEESDARVISNGIFDFPFAGRIKDFRQTTTIRVVRLNKPIQDDLFVFTPPAGARQVETLFKQTVDLGGTEAVDFTLRDLDGREETLSRLRGKVVLLDFWATWCGPCVKALPILERLHRAYRDQGLVVLGIDAEKPEKIRAFLKKHDYTFPTLVDVRKQVAGQYQVRGIPTTFVIDRNGKIVLHKVGLSSTTERELRDALQKAGVE